MERTTHRRRDTAAHQRRDGRDSGLGTRPAVGPQTEARRAEPAVEVDIKTCLYDYAVLHNPTEAHERVPRPHLRHGRSPTGRTRRRRCARRRSSASSSSTGRWARRSRRSASPRAHFRGERFAGCECHLQGNNDLLTLTQPQAIEDIHFAYAMAGADILETNTFSSTSIAQADYGMQDVVYELNRDGARLARRAAIKAERADGTAPFRRRRARADQPHRLALARRQQSGLPRRHVRRPARRLRRADPRPDRRRRRPDPDRDDLRHAERQGGDLRLRGDLRRARPAACR